MKKGYHKKGRRFVNTHIDSTKRSLIDIVLWQLGFYNDKKEEKRDVSFAKILDTNASITYPDEFLQIHQDYNIR